MSISSELFRLSNRQKNSTADPEDYAAVAAMLKPLVSSIKDTPHHERIEFCAKARLEHETIVQLMNMSKPEELV